MVRWLADVLELLYPPRCVVGACRGRGAWLCPSCQAAIRAIPAPACARCGLPLTAGDCPACALHPPAFDRSVAAGVYEAPLSDALRALKYARVTVLAELLGALAVDVLGGTTAELVVPVPAHRQRVATRGVDHAALLARVVAGRCALPLAPEALRRTRRTRPQAGLGPGDRLANVAGAFRATLPLAGRHLLLVDDVLTTGATASACAEALRTAGARRVTVLTVARALGPAGARHGPGL